MTHWYCNCQLWGLYDTSLYQVGSRLCYCFNFYGIKEHIKRSQSEAKAIYVAAFVKQRLALGFEATLKLKRSFEKKLLESANETIDFHRNGVCNVVACHMKNNLYYEQVLHDGCKLLDCHMKIQSKYAVIYYGA